MSEITWCKKNHWIVFLIGSLLKGTSWWKWIRLAITSDEMHTLTECKCQWLCSVSHIHDIPLCMFPRAYSASTSLRDACREGEWHKTLWESPSPPPHTYTPLCKHDCWPRVLSTVFGAETPTASYLCLSQHFPQLCGAVTEIYLRRWEGFSRGHYTHPSFPFLLY